MNRLMLSLAVALAIAPAPALAQGADPTPAQLAKAKKAFGEGRAFFEKGDFPEAIAKFKESYQLSKNPVLLYNIGFANESAGMDDIALFYYRKFLTDAPADAAQRAEVTDRVKALEKKFQTGGTTATAPTGPATTPATTTKPEPARTEPVKIKPPGTYQADAFQHAVVDAAPPKKPLDVTAFVPEDSGFVVTLFYRTAGEGKFTAKVMRWRYKELVARIPPEKMLGDSVQYYIEVKDSAGTVVTRNGKSTSPNLVTLEAGAPLRFYPDFKETDDTATASAGGGDTGGGATAPAGGGDTVAEVAAEDTEEDPLTGKRKTPPKKVAVVDEEPIGGGGEIAPGGGMMDVGSSKFTYVKWGTTAGAAALLGTSLAMYLSAGSYATALEDDSTACGAPPCRPFDPYAADLESAGKSRQTLSQITFGVGLGVAAVAGYFWYKDLTAKKRGEVKVSGKAGAPEMSWIVAPSVGEGFTGAAAAARF